VIFFFFLSFLLFHFKSISCPAFCSRHDWKYIQPLVFRVSSGWFRTPKCVSTRLPLQTVLNVVHFEAKSHRYYRLASGRAAVMEHSVPPFIYYLFEPSCIYFTCSYYAITLWQCIT
jgi:hypothetical protein